MEDNVQKNKDEFIAIFKDKIRREGSDKLLEYLEKSDFFTAPASAQYHLACPGGLCEHSLNVYNRLLYLINQNSTPEFNPSDETVAIVSLLHDLCKIDCYKPARKSRKTGEYYPNGKPVWEDYDSYERDEKFPYGHGEKSVYIIAAYMRLTREEAIAIRWHMGPWMNDDNRDVSKAFEQYPLAVLNHIADMEASYLDEER